MRMLYGFLLLIPSIASADPLTDLRATLTKLTATTPVHGSLDLTTDSKSVDGDDPPESGKASIAFESGEAGLRILYPRAMLTLADQEARREAMDPEGQTPARVGLRRLLPLHLNELLDSAAALNTALQSAQLVSIKPVMYHGKPSRLMVLKVQPKLSKSDSKRVKKMDIVLSLWLGEDGVPVAAERTSSLKASILLISLTSDEKETWTFAREGDRLVAVRHDQSQKSDGLGQHRLTQHTETLKFE